MKENDNYTRELLTFDLIKANLYGMFSIIPILIIYLIPIILSGKTVLTKKNLKDLLIYYKDNGYLTFWLVLLY
jgi:hypothetical protein